MCSYILRPRHHVRALRRRRSIVGPGFPSMSTAAASGEQESILFSRLLSFVALNRSGGLVWDEDEDEAPWQQCRRQYGSHRQHSTTTLTNATTLVRVVLIQRWFFYLGWYKKMDSSTSWCMRYKSGWFLHETATHPRSRTDAPHHNRRRQRRENKSQAAGLDRQLFCRKTYIRNEARNGL